jgi:hypothetical protein
MFNSGLKPGTRSPSETPLASPVIGIVRTLVSGSPAGKMEAETREGSCQYPLSVPKQSSRHRVPDFRS